MTPIKKILPPEYITTHVKANNRMVVEYTYWATTSSLRDLRHFVAHTIKAPKEYNSKCVFSPEYFSWFLN